jgi:DNA-binding transcriptional regulator YiaG
MLEFEYEIWQDCILPEMCDTQEMLVDTGHILFAEDCDDTLPNTPEVPCVHPLIPPIDMANIACDLDTVQYTVKRASCHAEQVQSKAVKVKTRKKNHSSRAVSVLSTHFDSNRKPTYMEKQSLAKKTGMSVDQVSMWFNNKRKRSCEAVATC